MRTLHPDHLKPPSFRATVQAIADRLCPPPNARQPFRSRRTLCSDRFATRQSPFWQPPLKPPLQPPAPFKRIGVDGAVAGEGSDIGHEVGGWGGGGVERHVSGAVAQRRGQFGRCGIWYRRQRCLPWGGGGYLWWGNDSEEVSPDVRDARRNVWREGHQESARPLSRHRRARCSTERPFVVGTERCLA